MASFVYFVLILATFFVLNAAMPPISVVASVRGKKFDVADVESVEDFTKKIEEIAGLEAGQQSVLFRGKVLNIGDNLVELGVADG